MKTTGLKAMVVMLAAILMAGQAYAGWGGGRRGGGGYGPGPERGIQGDTDEQGPWMRPGPGRGGSDVQTWQGGPGRGRGGYDSFGPQARGPRMGRGWARRSNGPARPEARLGRGGRANRGYRRPDVCPYCQGVGRRPAIQRRPMRGNWEQGLRGGKAGRGFRRDADVPGRGVWNGPRRGLQGRNVDPQGPGPMIQRRPWGGNRGQGPRPEEGIGRGFQGRDPGPQGFEPGRGGRGFRRGDAPAPQGQGQDTGRPDRDKRPLPRPRGARDRNGLPGLRQGPGGPVERPEVEDSDAAPEAPADANSLKEASPTSDGV